MALSTSSNVFLTGATGYVGGSFLSRLLELPTPPHKITALIRSSEKIKIFENLSERHTNCIGVQGSYEDHHLLERLASENEVVVQTADCDDVPMMQAILKGMKRRHEKTGKVGVLVHVSGTGTIVDDARGMYEGKNVGSSNSPCRRNAKLASRRSTPTCLLHPPLIPRPRPSTHSPMMLSTVPLIFYWKQRIRKGTAEHTPFYQERYGANLKA